MHFISIMIRFSYHTDFVFILIISACVLIFGHCIWLAKGGSMYRRVSYVSSEPIWTNQGMIWKLVRAFVKS